MERFCMKIERKAAKIISIWAETFEKASRKMMNFFTKDFEIPPTLY